MVLLNKHELLADAEARADLDHQVRERLRFIGDAPVLKISALSGKGVHKLLPALSMTIEDYHRRVPTGRVNEVLRARAAGPAGAPRRARALRHPGRHRPADLHAVLQPDGAGARTCATSSAASARPSTSAPPPSRCGSVAAADRAGWRQRRNRCRLTDDTLPMLDADVFLTDGGLETTLIFEDGFELPDFAAFALLDDERRVGPPSVRYFDRYADIARAHGVGIVLETPTWRASTELGQRRAGLDADAVAAVEPGRGRRSSQDDPRSPSIG